MIIINKQTKGGIMRLGFFTLVSIIIATFLSFNNKEKAKVSSIYEYGKASYYGHPFIGRKTANGEIFTEFEYTCAHKTLPFGTKLKVTNLANNQSIIVRVNDRGPFVKSRVLDLSIQGAKEIGLIQSGVANVTVEIVNSRYSSLGNTKQMEKIAIDNEYAYVDMSDDRLIDQIFAYLKDTGQLETTTKEVIYTKPIETVKAGTSSDENALDSVK
jgi:rare lipoprotein A